MKDPELWETLRGYGADLFVVAAYGKILPPEILQIPPRGCVNIHASLLPAYRGAAPIQWAVIDGQKESGITTMQMDAGLDTGDILRQYPVAIAEDETGGSLFDKLQKLGGEAILDTIRGLEEGSITPVKQGEMTTPYAAMLTKEDGNVDWNKSAAEIGRLVRGLDPWPGAYSFLDGKMIRLRKTAEAPEKSAAVLQGSEAPAPGTLINEGGKLYVMTGSGLLEITELQPEGKRPMPADAWLRGARLAEGSCFTRTRS
jgi:methionyl-tRNA formyltransferase